MTQQKNEPITIRASVHAPIQKIWDYWTDPFHIKKWNNASADWHTTKAVNNVKTGGNFDFRMEAKDGSFGFDFGGIYDQIEEGKLIKYTLGDGRKVSVIFQDKQGQIEIEQCFEPEAVNSLEMQKNGWQAILDNFKTYVETN